MRGIGIIIALFVGINTEYFADRGVVGWICYVALIVIAVLLAMGRRKNEQD